MADTSRNPGDSANFEELRAQLRQMRGELSALKAEAEAATKGQRAASARSETEVKQLANEVRARGRAGAGAAEAAPASTSDVTNARAAAAAESDRARAAEQTAQAKARGAQVDAAAARSPYPSRAEFAAYGVRQPLGPAPGLGQLYPTQNELQAYAARARVAPMPIGAAGVPGGAARASYLENVRAAGRVSDEAVAANEKLSGSLSRISSEYGTTAYQARVYSDQIHNHGALTTEFIQALARGEVSLRDFGNELILTGGKFAGWTIAATAIYGAARAFGTLARGAIDAQSATRGLERFIPGLNQGQATAQLLGVSRQLNVPVSDVGQAQQLFARIFPSETDSITAARTALLAYKLDQISVADSTRFLTAVTQEFQLPASRLPSLFDQISAAQRRMGARVAETLPGLARSAAAVKNAGGDLSQLVALIATAQVASGQTGSTVGTAFTRSAANFIRQPASQQTLQGFGINTNQGYTQTLIDAVRRAQTLSGPDRIALSKAIGGPQYGARIFQSLINNDPRLERALGVTSQQASRGSAAEELNKVLGQADERLRQIGNTVQRIGAELVTGGFATGAGLLLTTLDHVLGDVDAMLGLFSKLPSPLKDALATALELGVALRVLGKFGFGQGLADVPLLGRVFNATPQARTTAQAALSGLKDVRAGAAADLERAQALALVQQKQRDDLLAQGNAVEADRLASAEESAAAAVAQVEKDREALALTEALVVTQEARLAALRGNVPLLGGPGRAAAADAAGAAGAVEAAGPAAVAGAGATVERDAKALAGEARTRWAAAGAALTSIGSGLRGFFLNPLTLTFAAIEGLPTLFHAITQAGKDAGNTLDQIDREQDPGSRSQLQQNIAKARARLRQHPSFFQQATRGIEVPIAGAERLLGIDAQAPIEQSFQAHDAAQHELNRLLAEQHAQALQLAAGLPQGGLAVSDVVGNLKAAVEKYRQGKISAAELDRTYKTAAAEIRGSADAISGGAKGADNVEHGLEVAQAAVIAVAGSHKQLATFLKGADLPTLAAALQQDAEDISQFGVNNASLAKAAAIYGRAIASYAADPKGGPKGQNLKAIKAAQSAMDTIVSGLQTQLQQTLALATTQGGSNSAYSTYDASINKLITDARAGVARARASRASASSRLDAAVRDRNELQKQLTAAEERLSLAPRPFGGDASNPLDPQFGGARTPDQAQYIKQLRDNVDRLRAKMEAAHSKVKVLADAERQRELKLEALLREAEVQQAQEQNSVRDLRAQLQAGREGDAGEGLLDQLRAAQADLTNDIKHHVGVQQRLQDELRVQQLEDSRLQAEVESIASRGALRSSKIDPTNVTAVDQSNLQALRDQIAALRKGPRSAARTKQLADLEAQLNQLEFQAAADARQQAQDLINARFGLRESQTDDPVRQAQLEVQKDRQLLGYAHTRTDKLNAQTQLNKDLHSSYDAYVQSQLDEIDFRAHVGKITSEQEVAALQRLLRYSHLSRDARRNILTQIYDLQHQNDQQLELNVGNIRLPTLYDIRRLAGSGTAAGRVTQVTQVNHVGITAHGASATDIAKAFDTHTGSAVKSAIRAGAVG